MRLEGRKVILEGWNFSADFFNTKPVSRDIFDNIFDLSVARVENLLKNFVLSSISGH